MKNAHGEEKPDFQDEENSCPSDEDPLDEIVLGLEAGSSPAEAALFAGELLRKKCFYRDAPVE